MTELGIDQSQASLVMSVFGGVELTSRLLMCVLGDYIKGHILYSYIIFSLGLSVLNFTATKATTFEHMLAYGFCRFTNNLFTKTVNISLFLFMFSL